MLRRRELLTGIGASTLTLLFGKAIAQEAVESLISRARSACERTDALSEQPGTLSTELLGKDAFEALKAAHKEVIHLADFYDQFEKNIALGNLTRGPNTYVISAITSFPSLSGNYADCTGSVFIGTDARTEEPIGFITHQEPHHMLLLNREEFAQHFRARVSEFLKRCDPGSISYGILGGNFSHKMRVIDSYATNYVNSILRMMQLIMEHDQLRTYKPRVLHGPELGDDTIDVLLIPRERKVVIQENTHAQRGYDGCSLSEYLQKIAGIARKQ